MASCVVPSQPAASSTCASHSQLMTSAARKAQSLASCSGSPATFSSRALSFSQRPFSFFRRVAWILASLVMAWMVSSRLPS